MTLAKSTSTNANSLGMSTADTAAQHRVTLENRLTNLATQVADSALELWAQYRPVTTVKGQAVWQLLRSTQPVQLLLIAALAVLAIALITLVTTFNGVLILALKMTALVLAAVAVWQWIFRGLHWADKQLPPVADAND